VGWAAGVVFGFRKKIVREHLLQAFPDKDPEWRRKILHDSFRHVGREGLATFLLSGLSKEEILARTEVEGLEGLQEAIALGKGVILATGHFGNWEIGGAGLAVRGIPLDIIVQHQRNPLFDIDLNRNRTRLGLRMIMRGEAPKETLRALRKGRVVGIAVDQNRRRDGVFVDFFGKKAATARGAAVFALRTGAPLFMAVCPRLEGKIARYRWSIEPVEFVATGDMEEDVLRLTQAYTEHLEREIRRTPEQYLWQHRRWKTQPPGA
jgi:KDO2-lipid IV(A) lauroyltransferase